MEAEKTGKRLEKRKKKMERRRLEREKAELEKRRAYRIEFFMKLGMLSIVALIVVDFVVTMYPIFMTEPMAFEVATVSFYLMQIFGILFGLGVYYAGKRMLRDTGIWGGVFQIDASIIATLNLSIFLIANPLRYTQTDLIINSLYFGLETISSILLLIYTILIAFFFILIGANSQAHPIRYFIMITGVLWLVELFLPALKPSVSVDPVLYSILSGFTWVVYGLTAYCFWKMIYEYEDLLPTTSPSPYRIK